MSHREPTDIHGWFGLSYANYLVMPRALLQSMPEEWQLRFTPMLDEFMDAFDHLESRQYKVLTGKWCYLSDLSEADLKSLGVTTSCEDDPQSSGHDPEDGCTPGDCCYYLDGEELDHHTASVFVPGPDPVPHYQRGRTHVPRADELAVTS